MGEVTQEVGETASLTARMADGVRSSFRGLVRGGRDLLIWTSYNLFLVLVLAAVVVAAAAVGGRKWKTLRKRSEKKPDGE